MGVNILVKYKKPFAISQVTKPYALLPGIGRFCELEGCNAPLVGKKVTRGRNGKKVSYFLSPPPTQRACCNSHLQKLEYQKTKEQRKKYQKAIRTHRNYMKEGIQCLIYPEKKYDQKMTPFRIMKIFFGNSTKPTDSIDLIITEKNNTELWNICEKTVKYSMPIDILPTHDLQKTVNEICVKIPQVEQS